MANPSRDIRVAEILSGLKPTPASYAAAAGALRALDGCELERMRVVLLATDTVDLVVPYLVVEGARRGLLLDVQVAPFGQLEQQALDPSSELHTAEPHAVVIAARIAGLSSPLTTGFLTLDGPGIAAEVGAVASRLAGIVDGLRKKLGTSKEKTTKTVYRVGNLSAASNMVALDFAMRRGNYTADVDAESGKIKSIDEIEDPIAKGELVVLPTIGAGYLFGAAAFVHVG